MTWTVKEGWLHRAVLGAGPIPDDDFEARFAELAEEHGWTPERIEALKAYYEQAAAPKAKE